jgi:hypothetical protein
MKRSRWRPIRHEPVVGDLYPIPAKQGTLYQLSLLHPCSHACSPHGTTIHACCSTIICGKPIIHLCQIAHSEHPTREQNLPLTKLQLRPSPTSHHISNTNRSILVRIRWLKDKVEVSVRLPEASGPNNFEPHKKV